MWWFNGCILMASIIDSLKLWWPPAPARWEARCQKCFQKFSRRKHQNRVVCWDLGILRRLFTISVKPLSFKNNEVLHSGQFSGEFYCLKRIVGNYFKTKYKTKGFEAPTDVFALFPNFLCAGRSSRASGENRSFGGGRGGGIVIRRE